MKMFEIDFFKVRLLNFTTNINTREVLFLNFRPKNQQQNACLASAKKLNLIDSTPGGSRVAVWRVQRVFKYKCTYVTVLLLPHNH